MVPSVNHFTCVQIQSSGQWMMVDWVPKREREVVGRRIIRRNKSDIFWWWWRMEMEVADFLVENRDRWSQGHRKKKDTWRWFDNSVGRIVGIMETTELKIRPDIMSNNTIGEIMDKLVVTLVCWRSQMVQCRECDNSGECSGKKVSV